MSTLVSYPGPGCVVEFMQGNQPQTAYVLEEAGGKLRVFTASKREVKLPATRLLPWSGPAHAAGLSRTEIEALLAERLDARRELTASVDAMELWSMAQGEVEHAPATWFAERAAPPAYHPGFPAVRPSKSSAVAHTRSSTRRRVSSRVKRCRHPAPPP